MCLTNQWGRDIVRTCVLPFYWTRCTRLHVSSIQLVFPLISYRAILVTGWHYITTPPEHKYPPVIRFSLTLVGSNVTDSIPGSVHQLYFWICKNGVLTVLLTQYFFVNTSLQKKGPLVVRLARYNLMFVFYCLFRYLEKISSTIVIHARVEHVYRITRTTVPVSFFLILFLLIDDCNLHEDDKLTVSINR